MAKKALVVDHVSMKFNLNRERPGSVRELLSRIRHGRLRDEFWALKDINFSLEKGDRIGILGLNGSGKSTLLKVIAGVFKPTEGTVKRYGKVVPLLELGAGFEKQYTGRENIYLYGTVLGYDKDFLDQHYDQIVEFSGLGKFIDVPIMNYSSGMRSKLGFSIATAVNPEILILDEVLSVGDVRFRRKSMRKIKSMMENETTVLFVSHSIHQVKRICNKAMILQNGKMIAMGDIDEIANIYEEMYGLERARLARKSRREARKARRFAMQQLEAAKLAVEEKISESGRSVLDEAAKVLQTAEDYISGNSKAVEEKVKVLGEAAKVLEEAANRAAEDPEAVEQALRALKETSDCAAASFKEMKTAEIIAGEALLPPANQENPIKSDEKKENINL